MPEKFATAVFSAPGKALLAGGYLVLFPEYTALSVALSSRIFAAVQLASDASTELRVVNPQFASEWRYPARSGPHANPYLDACYDVVCAYFGRPVAGALNIWSDDGFHSQHAAARGAFGPALARFASHGRPITEVPKTGLGSSAALVVSVVAALVALATQADRVDARLVHNLAQTAHCIAQGKVGSGFDVATAVYGSILYSRFPASNIVADVADAARLRAVADSAWEMQAAPFHLPSGLAVLMGDVQQGSETPNMVKQVLAWRAAHPDAAARLFGELDAANTALAAELSRGARADATRAAVAAVRACLQQLTRLSGVPVEPAEQTQLLDAAARVPGVLGGVVPGAGGYDAVCVLADTRARPLEATKGDLAAIAGVEWTELGVEPAGLQNEDPAQFPWSDSA